MNEYTLEQVKEHNSASSAWIIIDSQVFDLTSFQKFHPGGELILAEYFGKDATEIFYSFHKQE